jgi:hypothetical protein
MTGETNVEPAPFVSAARQGAAATKAAMANVILTYFLMTVHRFLVDKDN